jgi:hypothetical protein
VVRARPSQLLGRDPTGIEVVSLYVRADGEQLAVTGRDLAAGRLDFELGASFPLAEAEAALARAVASRCARGLAPFPAFGKHATSASRPQRTVAVT